MVVSVPAASRVREAPAVAALALGMALGIALDAAPASSQILPWEVNVAEVEAGRLRALAERLVRQNLLYQLHLGDVRKSDLLQTAERIDRLVDSLEKGDSAYSIPPPWTPALRERVDGVDAAWGPLRQVATASPYDYFRMPRQFGAPEDREADPLLLRYFDNLATGLIAESEKLVDAYHAECVETGLAVCPTARSSGYAEMLVERATKGAIYIVAGIDVARHRAALEETVEAYGAFQQRNDQSPFFAEALDPARGASAAARAKLFASLREDWDRMRGELAMLAAGDEQNFDLRHLLAIQSRLIAKIERLSAALLRYASRTYGG